MPVKKEAWPEGTPAWVDLMAPDFAAAKAFYTGVFGWEFSESGEEFGYYAVASVDGEPVAGIGPVQGPDGPPPAWTTYVAVEDAEAAAARVAAAGGTVFAPPMKIGDFGTMAFAVDPTGCLFGLWQSGQHTGVNRYNEQGSLAWNEAMTGDYLAGKEFYATVFGYTYTEIGDERFSYSTVELDGRTVGGIGTAAEVGEGVPPHWRTYFAVDDLDGTIATVVELGGAVVVAPFDTPFGRMAAVSGVAGEVFLLNEVTPQAGAATPG
ncbi:VOC family protein [Microlunatus ginsengisoli]|uniref:VOC family protein n=1 Tax=Microlunatus ginsengisoli TaxID=363863 RepID=A0ABP7AA22_9ACTN